MHVGAILAENVHVVPIIIPFEKKNKNSLKDN